MKIRKIKGKKGDNTVFIFSKQILNYLTNNQLLDNDCPDEVYVKVIFDKIDNVKRVNIILTDNVEVTSDVDVVLIDKDDKSLRFKFKNFLNFFFRSSKDNCIPGVDFEIYGFWQRNFLISYIDFLLDNSETIVNNGVVNVCDFVPFDKFKHFLIANSKRLVLPKGLVLSFVSDAELRELYDKGVRIVPYYESIILRVLKNYEKAKCINPDGCDGVNNVSND